MMTIYVDSRKRMGSDSDFEVDLGELLHLQSDARLVYKIRLADSFLSTDRGCSGLTLGTLTWALLPESAYTAGRLGQLQQTV